MYRETLDAPHQNVAIIFRQKWTQAWIGSCLEMLGGRKREGEGKVKRKIQQEQLK